LGEHGPTNSGPQILKSNFSCPSRHFPASLSIATSLEESESESKLAGPGPHLYPTQPHICKALWPTISYSTHIVHSLQCCIHSDDRSASTVPASESSDFDVALYVLAKACCLEFNEVFNTNFGLQSNQLPSMSRMTNMLTKTCFLCVSGNSFHYIPC